MNFQPGLAAKVMAGEKTVTRRICNDNPRSPWWLRRCSLKPGRSYAVCPGRGKNAIGRVVVVSVRYSRLGDVDDGEARREGFDSAESFAAAFRQINGEYDPDLLCWRVEFRVDAPKEQNDGALNTEEKR